jgi:hypothetical protein
VYGRLCGDYWMDHRSAKNQVILSGIYLSIAENAIVKNKSQKMIFQPTQTK